MSTELHDQLDQLVGTWRARGRIVDGPAAGDTWTGHDVYEWFPGRRHLVHRVDVEMGGQRNEGLEILTPRDATPATIDQTSTARLITAAGTGSASVSRQASIAASLTASGSRQQHQHAGHGTFKYAASQATCR